MTYYLSGGLRFFADFSAISITTSTNAPSSSNALEIAPCAMPPPFNMRIVIRLSFHAAAPDRTAVPRSHPDHSRSPRVLAPRLRLRP